MDEITPSLNRIYELITQVANRIEEINGAIELGGQRLRECQPRWGGVILLYFKDHGTKPTCFGCPHLDWKMMLPNKHSRTKVALSRIKGNPAKAIVRSGPLRDCYPEVQATISYILELEKEKRSYTQVLVSLRKCMGQRGLDTTSISEAEGVADMAAALVRLLNLRLKRIDHELRSHASTLSEIQPGSFSGKVRAKIYVCRTRNCYSCSHVNWFTYRYVRRSREKLEQVSVERPLFSLPKVPELKRQTAEVRDLIKRMEELLEEKRSYQRRIRQLANVFYGRFDVESAREPELGHGTTDPHNADSPHV